MKRIFCLLVILFIVQPIFAYSGIDVNLEINQETLKPEDPFIANLILKNNLNYSHTIIIESILKDESETYVRLLPPIYEELNAGEEKKIELYNFTIIDTFKEGIYLLKVRIIAQNNSIETDKEFTITGTLVDLLFSLESCKDLSCTEKSKIFVKNEDIYLNYSSEVSEPDIIATLTYPDKTTKQINLPTFIKAVEIGTYILSVEVSKEDYKSLETLTQFAVIEKHAEIKDEISCNTNLICEPEKGESFKNCPEDCPSGSMDGYCDGINDEICDPDCSVEEDVDCKESIGFTWVSMIIGIIIVVSFILFLKNHSKTDKNWKSIYYGNK